MLYITKTTEEEPPIFVTWPRCLVDLLGRFSYVKILKFILCWVGFLTFNIITRIKAVPKPIGKQLNFDPNNV